MEVFSMLLGGLFLLGCFVGGLVFAAVRKGKIRACGLLVAGASLVVMLVPFVAMRSFATLSSMKGTYVGSFDSGQYTFVLRSNGTYDQNFVADGGKATTNHGTWRPASSSLGCFDFDHLLMPKEGFASSTKKEITNFGGACSDLFGGSIVFDDDSNIEITRVGR